LPASHLLPWRPPLPLREPAEKRKPGLRSEAPGHLSPNTGTTGTTGTTGDRSLKLAHDSICRGGGRSRCGSLQKKRNPGLPFEAPGHLSPNTGTTGTTGTTGERSLKLAYDSISCRGGGRSLAEYPAWKPAEKRKPGASVRSPGSPVAKHRYDRDDGYDGRKEPEACLRLHLLPWRPTLPRRRFGLESCRKRETRGFGPKPRVTCRLSYLSYPSYLRSTAVPPAYTAGCGPPSQRAAPAPARV
jgi:hypothetical protein